MIIDSRGALFKNRIVEKLETIKNLEKRKSILLFSLIFMLLGLPSAIRIFPSAVLPYFFLLFCLCALFLGRKLVKVNKKIVALNR
jgi:hypothetical protein